MLLFIFQNLYAGTIKIPSDQPTIQAGIDSSAHGDTVLVSAGTYYENINFNGKNIVLGSLFLTTGDTSYISQTIIDGNRQGCVVVFESGEDSTAMLTGFTITNGYSSKDFYRGGGITCANFSNPKLSNLIIINNEAEYCYGGGILCRDSSQINLINSLIRENRADKGGGFSSINSNSKLNDVTIIGNKSRSGGGIYLDSSNVVIEHSIIKKNIDNGYYGGGGIHATNSTELIIINSHIIENESKWKSIAAIGPFGDGGGIYLRNNSTAVIKDCKINNNSSIVNGGGICVFESSVEINRSEINGNTSERNGGGIYIQNHDGNVFLENVQIGYNTCSRNGGGIYYFPDQPIEALRNIVIRNNFSGGSGGGLETNSNLLISESSGFSIFLNKAKQGGTDIHMEVEDTSSMTTLYLDTTTVSDPNDYQIYPIMNIDLHYNHAVFQSVDSDLYVSPTGSNSNKGTSKDAPLNTIDFALLVTSADSISRKTIYLAPGTYSPSTNGEEFPLIGRSYISIKGKEANTTILDGEYKTRLIELSFCKKVSVENFTIQNGYDRFGGGMYVSGKGLLFKNLIIKDNYSEVGAGGLFLYYSDQVDLVNLTVVNNKSNSNDSVGGGIVSRAVYNLTILNSIIVSNNPINLELSSINPPLPFSDTNTVMIGYSNIGGGKEGIYKHNEVVVHWLDGNIDTDPLFVSGNPFDYNLTDSSPCINAGTPFLVWEGDTLINLSPSEYIGEAPDMGALESDVLISVEGEDHSIDGFPTEFKLEQNYPNPFNPSTTIKYSIPSVTHPSIPSREGKERSDRGVLVMLNIYDILGREVATLVNKQQKPGNYEVKFDASNITSGLYFYRITSTPSGGQAGSFMKTMKMILLK